MKSHFFDMPNAALFASPDCEDARREAKEWIAANNMHGKVKVILHDDMIIVKRL